MRWLASFPERNPNPIVVVEPTPVPSIYQNHAAARLFPDLDRRRSDHPYLAGFAS